jgi:hypothetical protein
MTVEKDVVKAVEQMVKICMRHLKKKEYEMKLTTQDVHNAVKHLNVYRRRNGRSSAGYRNININVDCWQFGNKVWTEYKSFKKDPIIGEIKVNDKLDTLLCLVAHEVSHYVQYTHGSKMPQHLRSRKSNDRGHGDCFKTIYRYLRRDLVNPTIEARRKEALEEAA